MARSILDEPLFKEVIEGIDELIVFSDKIELLLEEALCFPETEGYQIWSKKVEDLLHIRR